MLIQFNEISVSISNIQHSHFPRILLAYEIQEISVKAFVYCYKITTKFGYNESGISED